MAKDLLGQRRRAAVAVLSGVLDESTLLQELWVQHDTLRGDAVTDIIEYVDALSRRHMLDVATAKRLYGEFFKALRQPEDSLPLDPWPAMQALRPSVAPAPIAAPVMPAPPMRAWPPPAMPPMAAPVLPPGMVPMMAAVAAAPPYASPTPAAGWAATAAVDVDLRALPPAAAAAAAPVAAPSAESAVVFGAVMRGVISEVTQFHADALDEIRNDAMRVLAGSPAPALLREQFGRAWQRAQQSDWKLAGQAADLSELVRVVHQALELAFGRVGADQILQRALSQADAMPEAQRFSAKRLMASL